MTGRLGTLKCERCQEVVRVAPLVEDGVNGDLATGLACACLVREFTARQSIDENWRDELPEQWRDAYEGEQ